MTLDCRTDGECFAHRKALSGALSLDVTAVPHRLLQAVFRSGITLLAPSKAMSRL